MTARLFQLIQELPEEQQRELFTVIGDQRLYQRKPYLMTIDYETFNGTYNDFILDISPHGVFIETQEQFFEGQELKLTMKFQPRNTPFNVTGTVVWQSFNGIGVKFIYTNIDQKKELAAIINRL